MIPVTFEFPIQRGDLENSFMADDVTWHGLVGALANPYVGLTLATAGFVAGEYVENVEINSPDLGGAFNIRATYCHIIA